MVAPGLRRLVISQQVSAAGPRATWRARGRRKQLLGLQNGHQLVPWSFPRPSTGSSSIDLEHGAKPAATVPLFDPRARRPQMAYKIDTSLVSPLRHLPHRIAANPSTLALRNLERGATFEFPSGQVVAMALGEMPIPGEKLVIGKGHCRRSEEAYGTDR